ncbi:hypothetical protein C2E23DRAFT_685188, partial [Lenzites betulinus]
LPANVKIAGDGESVRVLGARVGNEVDRIAAWQPIMRTIRGNLDRWASKKISMYGRKLIVGLEVGSRTQFMTMAQGMPRPIEDELVGMVASFMWSGLGSPMVNRETLSAPIDRGGL